MTALHCAWLQNSDDSVVRCAPGMCSSGKVSFKIDDQLVSPWPKVESIKISGLDAATKHRVIIYRAGKPQQSFRFHFSEFKSNEACLFLNDLYWTAQLWDPKRAPWCKCQQCLACATSHLLKHAVLHH
jgi:hypothetical protein